MTSGSVCFASRLNRVAKSGWKPVEPRIIGRVNYKPEVQARGFVVKVIAPQFVTPYVKSNKNDANDAEAICEAMSRPNMHFVKPKTVSQQDIQAVHRIRQELM